MKGIGTGLSPAIEEGVSALAQLYFGFVIFFVLHQPCSRNSPGASSPELL